MKTKNLRYCKGVDGDYCGALVTQCGNLCDQCLELENYYKRQIAKQIVQSEEGLDD